MFAFDLSRNSLGKFGNKIKRQANTFCDIGSHDLARTHSISGLKSRITIFDLKMIVQGSLEFF